MINNLFSYINHFWTFVDAEVYDEGNEFYLKEMGKYNILITKFNHTQLETLFRALGLDKSELFGFKWTYQHHRSEFPNFKIFKSVIDLQEFIEKVFLEYIKQGGSYADVVCSDNPSIFFPISHTNEVFVRYLKTPENKSFIEEKLNI